MESITRFITSKLKLKAKAKAQKSAVAQPGERKFLGLSFTFSREPKRRITPMRSRGQVRELASRNAEDQ